MIKIEDKTMCSGCTACKSICPKKCISMVEDNEGFKYPEVKESECIDCRLCEKVCPVKNVKNEGYEEVDIYGIQNKDENIRSKSTSGGAFGAIACYVLDRGGTVWAAGFDENAIVCHMMADTRERLSNLFGSKYVQSDLKDSFGKIKELLCNNQLVFFTGTPCQTQGLLHCIDEKLKKNLITADFACYGVPSPKLYRKWIETLEQRNKNKVEKVIFRDKKYGYAGVNVRVNFKNGKFLEDKYEVKTFGKTMFKHIGLRPVCYNCHFRGQLKECDFTLSDMWQIGEFDKTMDDDKGTTYIQVHSTKGKEIFESIKDKLRIAEVSSLSGDELLRLRDEEKYYFKIPNNREKFFSEIDSLEYEKLIEKYIPASKKEKIACTIKPIIVRVPGSRHFFRIMKEYKRKNYGRNKR